MLIALAGVVGSVIGGVAAWHYQGLGQWVWPLGLTVLVVVLERIGAYWIWGPYELLVGTLERIAGSERRQGLEALPVTRRDEVGRLARNVHDLISGSIRLRRQAQLVRRTMDVRVAEATRKATQRLHHIAMRDALTNLGNRRFLDETLETLVQTVQASRDELVCMLIDVDNFKQVNDTLGHPTGDELLILLGSLLRASMRYSDYAVRLGGDEFVLLMPGCSVERATLLAERIGALFRQHTHTTMPTDLHVTLSIGIASLGGKGAVTGEELLEAADRKLYEAKRGGKSRTVSEVAV